MSDDLVSCGPPDGSCRSPYGYVGHLMVLDGYLMVYLCQLTVHLGHPMVHVGYLMGHLMVRASSFPVQDIDTPAVLATTSPRPCMMMPSLGIVSRPASHGVLLCLLMLHAGTSSPVPAPCCPKPHSLSSPSGLSSPLTHLSRASRARRPSP